MLNPAEPLAGSLSSFFAEVVMLEGIPVTRGTAMHIVGKREASWSAMVDICERLERAPPGATPFGKTQAYQYLTTPDPDRLALVQMMYPRQLIYDPAHEA